MQGAVDYFRFGVTLFGILNPFAAIPMFLILTDPADRSRTARIAGLAVFGFLGVAGEGEALEVAREPDAAGEHDLVVWPGALAGLGRGDEEIEDVHGERIAQRVKRSRWGWWSRFQRLNAASVSEENSTGRETDSTWPSQKPTLALPA